ncbi:MULTISPECIES: lysophospholipid acyltransferase family protein [Barrientosiimonas]|uniref:Acyltransferase n=1 Tax=Barrientosiimonas endolithica TaxID=1535208 RepID=A0ABM8HAB4_9MICO|nr:lysophospholipid acyltransferase family protein [Barrientosiimonas endolithica]BDZ57876.1 putative acyltransferase [Barrientosiimonas endolithica]
MEPVYTPVIGFALTVFRAQGLRFTITGSENVPRQGGGVVVMNHLSYFDYAYAGLPAREQGRIVRWMAKKEIFDNPVMGPLMRGMKHIPVDRKAGVGAYQEAVSALRRGELVGVFPETTISRSLELREFKTGAVRMALEADVPMIPVVAFGNHRVWTKDQPKRLGRSNVPIHMDVGTPIHVPEGANAVEETHQLRETMTAMLHRLQEAYPPLGPDEQGYVPARLGGSAPTPERAKELEAQEAQRRAAKRKPVEQP